MNTGYIGTRQAVALIMLEVGGVGFVLIPRLALSLAWRSGLWGIILGTLAVSLYACFIIGVFDGRDLFYLCEKQLGKLTAVILRCGFIAKTVVFSGLCLKLFSDSLVEVVEGDIPFFAISGAMTAAVLYPVFKGRETRGRLAELFVIPFFAVIAFVFICSANGGLNELLPVEGDGILECAYGSAMWFFPLEYLLMSLPYIRIKGNRRSFAVKCGWAFFVVGILITTVFALTIIRLGAAQMQQTDFAVLEIMYSVSVPASFLERQEGLMLGVWVVGVFFTLSGGLYHSGTCAGEMLKGISSAVASVLCAAATFILSLLPYGDDTFSMLITVMLFAESVYLTALPVVIYISRFLEGKKNEVSN